MHKKYRDAQGKAINFYKLRMGRKAAISRGLLIRSMAFGVLSAGMQHYRAIQHSATDNKLDKRIALAKCAVETVAAVNKVLKTDPFKKENAA